MPHISRPQMEPVTRLAARNASPTSVVATAAASNLKFLVTRKPALARKAAHAAVMAAIATGTWKKIILNVTPCCVSSGKRAMAMVFHARIASAKSILSRIFPPQEGRPGGPPHQDLQQSSGAGLLACLL